jgi:hypothetical protein
MLIKEHTPRALLLGAALAFILVGPVFGQPPGDALGEPMVKPAIDGIFDALKTNPLVGLSNKHGLAQRPL